MTTKTSSNERLEPFHEKTKEGIPPLFIAPSLLAADTANLESECQKFLPFTKWLHIDVMDGHFVPNISFGIPIVASIRAHFTKEEAFLDCHMMVSNPEKWVAPIAKAGGSMYNFHLEATDNPESLIDLIHKNKMKACCAIKPGTSIEELIPIASRLDMVLIMTVEPGFGGQSFLENMLPKITYLRLKFPNLYIEVDGGIDLNTIGKASYAGANVMVAGTSLFKSRDRDVVDKFLRKASECRHAMV